MQFPIEFIDSGRYGFLAPVINVTGSMAVVMVGGISLGVIANIALTALGFKTAAMIVSAVPIAIGAICGFGAIAGCVALASMFYGIRTAMADH